MATLTVSRDSGYADRLRAYAVILDGKKIGEVRNGETKEFPINSGAHEISMKIDWAGSRKLNFSATNGEPLSFQVKSNLRGLKVVLALWYVIFTPKSYLLLEQTSNPSFKRDA